MGSGALGHPQTGQRAGPTARPEGKVLALGLLRGPGPGGPHHVGSGQNADRIYRTELQLGIKRASVPKVKSKL